MSVQLICQELKNKDRNWETNRKLSCFYSTTTGIKTSISHLNVYKTQVIETAKIQELIWKYNDKQKYLNIYFAAKTDEWEAIERNESEMRDSEGMSLLPRLVRLKGCLPNTVWHENSDVVLHC